VITSSRDLAASIDGKTRFDSMGQKGVGERLGLLRGDMNAHFVINDDQHGLAAIEMVLEENPPIWDETIAVVFFVDQGLNRSRQMFADLNEHAVRPTKSLGLLYGTSARQQNQQTRVRATSFQARPTFETCSTRKCSRCSRCEKRSQTKTGGHL